jgi:hypothetical protein
MDKFPFWTDILSLWSAQNPADSPEGSPIYFCNIDLFSEGSPEVHRISVKALLDFPSSLEWTSELDRITILDAHSGQIIPAGKGMLTSNVWQIMQSYTPIFNIAYTNKHVNNQDEPTGFCKHNKHLLIQKLLYFLFCKHNKHLLIQKLLYFWFCKHNKHFLIQKLLYFSNINKKSYNMINLTNSQNCPM